MQDSTPHFDAILDHVGTPLTPPVQQEKDDPAVVAIEVPPLAHRIPYEVLRERLRTEEGDFLVRVYCLEPEDGLPVPGGVAVH